MHRHSPKKVSFTEPIFIKDSSSIPKQIEKLKQLKKVSNKEQAEKIDQDIKMLYSGLNGENTVAYELKNSYLPILILQDLNLKSNDLTAQIDFIIISQTFLLVIECKKLLDDIEITEKGDFNRCFKTPTGLVYKKEGMYNPITQNQRHIEIIKKLFNEHSVDFDSKKYSGLLKQIVILANTKTVIRDNGAPEDVKDCIIKCDQLISFLKNAINTATTNKLSEEDMRQFADILVNSHSERKAEYTQKYPLQTPICPHCKIKMVKRTAKKGSNTGNEFYGCPNYPACKQTININ